MNYVSGASDLHYIRRLQGASGTCCMADPGPVLPKATSSWQRADAEEEEEEEKHKEKKKESHL